MHDTNFFLSAFLYLATAVLMVPVAHRLGLGSVLGYLIGGALIGPFALGWVGGAQGEEAMHFAEFGVVIMLFMIGLELEPSRLWRMRGPIFGLGGLQVVLTSLAGMGVSAGLGVPPKAALAIGMILSLSSTAIVIQTLQEKSLMQTDAGGDAFSVLLFQDIAVIPMLAVFPLLASGDPSGGDSQGWIHSLPHWARPMVTLGAVASIVFAGQFLVPRGFAVLARTGLRELLTAAALLLIVGVAVLMTQVGLSQALGAFVAGVVLAGSHYRHELESNLEPFKGLLLGLFFLAVGASLDFDVVRARPALIAALVVGLIVLKAGVLFAAAAMLKIRGARRWLLSSASPRAVNSPSPCSPWRSSSRSWTMKPRSFWWPWSPFPWPSHRCCSCFTNGSSHHATPPWRKAAAPQTPSTNRPRSSWPASGASAISSAVSSCPRA